MVVTTQRIVWYYTLPHVVPHAVARARQRLFLPHLRLINSLFL